MNQNISLKGRIIRGVGGFYYVKTLDDKTYECVARGIFRKNGLTPLPGDNVIFKITDQNDEKGALEQILPRQSLLLRPAVANVDQIIFLIAAKSPEPDLLLLDKVLITAYKKNIDVLICINKIDLDPEGKYYEIVEAYRKSGYDAVAFSSKVDTSLDCITGKLSGRISVMAGQSGVGKSTLLNRIVGSLSMETGGMSQKIMRGKHTTRHAQLFELATGGYFVDTPGFSMFELEGIEHDELQQYYPEFYDHLGNCKFRSCNHINEPGCSIKDMVNTGEIDIERYQRYIQIFDALKSIKKY